MRNIVFSIICATILLLSISTVLALDINECDDVNYTLPTTKLILDNWYTTSPAIINGVNVTLYKSNYNTVVNVITSCAIPIQSFDITVYQKLADGSTHSSTGGGGSWSYNNTIIKPSNQSNVSIVNNTILDVEIVNDSCVGDCEIQKPGELGKTNYGLLLLILLGVLLFLLLVLIIKKLYSKLNITREVKK